MATATATTTTTTKIPFVLTPDNVHVSEECFSNTPSSSCVFLHRMLSTHNDCGFQALLVFDSTAHIPDGVSLAPMIVEDLTCHLQVCPPMDTFYKAASVPDHLKMTISIENYLDLFAFIHCKWPNVLAQMIKNASSMAEGNNWVRIKPYLLFLNDGICHYKALLGPDLSFCASVNSQNIVNKGAGGKDEFIVQINIMKKDQTLNLPLSTISKLFSNIEAYQHIHTAYLMACQKKTPSVGL